MQNTLNIFIYFSISHLFVFFNSRIVIGFLSSVLRNVQIKKHVINLHNNENALSWTSTYGTINGSTIMKHIFT